MKIIIGLNFVRGLFIVLLLSVCSQVYAQELSMFQGNFSQFYYEDDVKISKKEFLDRIKSDPVSSEYWSKYRLNNGIATGTSLLSGGALVWWINRESFESKTAPAVATIGGLVLTWFFSERAIINRRDAIISYNKNATTSYRVTPSNNGIGLAVHF